MYAECVLKNFAWLESNDFVDTCKKRVFEKIIMN